MGQFVAVATTGTGNRVMTSPDGITWAPRTSAADNGWRGVVWAGDLVPPIVDLFWTNHIRTQETI